MSIREAIGAAWGAHADDPQAVFAELGTLDPTSPGELFGLAAITAHVGGDHLGDFPAALDRLGALREHPLFSLELVEGKGLRRLMASLHHAAGESERCETALTDAITEEQGEDAVRARVLAVAASMLAANGRTAQAASDLERAVELAGERPVTPVARALAITGNNLACDLEETADRSPEQTSLMTRAAAIARVYWAQAGDWHNVRKAEVRQAYSHLAAQEHAVALGHADAALAMVDENGGGDAERFFPWVAKARILASAGEENATVVARATKALGALDDGLREYAQGELASL